MEDEREIGGGGNELKIVHRNLGFGSTKGGRREGLKIKEKRIMVLNIVWIYFWAVTS